MLNCSRNIEIFWNSLFDDNPTWYRCIQDVEIKFTSVINIKETYLTIQLPFECQRVLSSWAFQVIFIHDIKSVCICYVHILKLPWNSDNSIIQNIHGQNYVDSVMLSYSCPFEEQCFPFSSLKKVNNWCCYESI